MRRLYYCDHHAIPLPPGHKFPAGKYALLRAALEKEGDYQLIPARPAEQDRLELAHDPAYVRSFLDGTIDARIMRRIGFPWSESLVRRTLSSVGGTLAAVSDAMESGFGGNLAGGTHHAFRDVGSGFCVFNDLAVAVASLHLRLPDARVAVLDLDVHQGDGTAAFFEGVDNVLTISLHGSNNFPFHKQRSRVDIALADGVEDAEYLSHVRSVLPQIAAFRPALLLYQSGVDGLAADRLGRLSLTPEGLAERDRLVFQFAADAGLPVTVTLGGGYAEPIELTVEAHFNTFRVAARVFT